MDFDPKDFLDQDLPIKKEKVSGDTISERGDCRGQLILRQHEAKRLLHYVYKAGVTKEAILYKQEDFKDNIDKEAYKESNAPVSLMRHVYEKESFMKWYKDGEMFFIYGGNIKTRTLISEVVLYKAILSCNKKRYLGAIGASINNGEFLIRIGDYNETRRFNVVNNLKKIPVVMFYGVDSIFSSRETSDAPALYESIFSERVLKNKITILTSAYGPKEIAQVGNKLGPAFRDLVAGFSSEKCFPDEKNSQLVRIKLRS